MLSFASGTANSLQCVLLKEKGEDTQRCVGTCIADGAQGGSVYKAKRLCGNVKKQTKEHSRKRTEVSVSSIFEEQSVPTRASPRGRDSSNEWQEDRDAIKLLSVLLV